MRRQRLVVYSNIICKAFHVQKCAKLTAGGAVSDFIASRAFFLARRGSALFTACSDAVRLQRRAMESEERDMGVHLWMDWVLRIRITFGNSCPPVLAEANLVLYSW